MAQILVAERRAGVSAGEALARAGHTVVAVDDGGEALARIERQPPDLVLAAVELPGLDGPALVKAVRERPPVLAGLPVILLATPAERERLLAGPDPGADDCLTLPVDERVLVAAVDGRLARVRQANALKDRQFVRLFKSLAKEPAGEAAAADPFGRIVGMAPPALGGRALLLHADDLVPGFAALPGSTRAQAAAVLARVTAESLDADDAVVGLGGGAVLAVLAGPADPAGRFAGVRARLARAFRQAAPAMGEDRGDPPGADASAGDEAMQAALAALLDGADGAAAPADAGFAGIAASIRIDYVPVWNARTSAVEAWRLRYGRAVGPHRLPEGRTLLRGAEDPLMCELQCHVLEAAVRDVMAVRATPDTRTPPPVVIVPLSLSVFQGLDAHKVERQLADMARLVDRASVGFHLMQMGEEIPTGLLRRVFALVAGAGSLIVADLDANDPRLPQLPGLGCRTLHLDAGVLRSGGWRHDRAMQAVHEAVRGAVQGGFELWVSNTDTVSEGRLVRSAGATLLSGRIVGEGRPVPDHAVRVVDGVM